MLEFDAEAWVLTFQFQGVLRFALLILKADNFKGFKA
jgi:hypothetical protein